MTTNSIIIAMAFIIAPLTDPTYGESVANTSIGPSESGAAGECTMKITLTIKQLDELCVAARKFGAKRAQFVTAQVEHARENTPRTSAKLQSALRAFDQAAWTYYSVRNRYDAAPTGRAA